MSLRISEVPSAAAKRLARALSSRFHFTEASAFPGFKLLFRLMTHGDDQMRFPSAMLIIAARKLRAGVPWMSLVQRVEGTQRVDMEAETDFYWKCRWRSEERNNKLKSRSGKKKKWLMARDWGIIKIGDCGFKFE